MKSKLLTVVTMASITLAAAACTKTPEPIEKGADTPYYGYITSGEKFDITVGQSRQAAKDTLAAGKLAFYGQEKCEDKTHRKIDCAPGDTFDVYRKKGIIKNGFIYVVFEGDTVTAVAWSFNYAVDM